jgi:hypothetical protein
MKAEEIENGKVDFNQHEEKFEIKLITVVQSPEHKQN